MPLVPMRQILDEAAKGGYGVGAFNVNNMEQIQAIMEAAAETKSPVIIQASRGALKYSKMIYLKKLMEAATEENPDIPVAMHLDHGNSVETCKMAIDLGFTSVMIDGSLAEDGKTPNTYEQNVEVTKKVVELAHPLGVSVEAEIGVLGGIEDGHGAGLSVDEASEHLTDPEEAKKFYEETGVDALAVAVGTSHGAYKSLNKDADGNILPPSLAMDRIVAINKMLPDCHLVMHGSSSVPQELVDIVNKHGGEMPGTAGIPAEKIREGIDHGVRKVNVDTDSRLAMTGAIRKVFAESPAKFDPRDYLRPAREAMRDLVYIPRMKTFGQAGHAGDYAPMSLDAMKKIYG
jgi:fructose-bisphosphate aldolase, class II